MELRSCPILLLFSSCLFYNLLGCERTGSDNTSDKRQNWRLSCHVKLSFRKINGNRRKCAHMTRATSDKLFQATNDKILNFYNFMHALLRQAHCRFLYVHTLSRWNGHLFNPTLLPPTLCCSTTCCALTVLCTTRYSSSEASRTTAPITYLFYKAALALRCLWDLQSALKCSSLFYYYLVYLPSSACNWISTSTCFPLKVF